VRFKNTHHHKRQILAAIISFHPQKPPFLEVQKCTQYFVDHQQVAQSGFPGNLTIFRTCALMPGVKENLKFETLISQWLAYQSPGILDARPQTPTHPEIKRPQPRIKADQG
jgi:hypothetical protein